MIFLIDPDNVLTARTVEDLVTEDDVVEGTKVGRPHLRVQGAQSTSWGISLSFPSTIRRPASGSLSTNVRKPREPCLKI
jgi:hypothetical protein